MSRGEAHQKYVLYNLHSPQAAPLSPPTLCYDCQPGKTILDGPHGPMGILYGPLDRVLSVVPSTRRGQAPDAVKHQARSSTRRGQASADGTPPVPPATGWVGATGVVHPGDWGYIGSCHPEVALWFQGTAYCEAMRSNPSIEKSPYMVPKERAALPSFEGWMPPSAFLAAYGVDPSSNWKMQLR